MTTNEGNGKAKSGHGILYGVGVGPGAPDLLTLRAVQILNSVSVILAAASPGNEDSLALSIAAPHLPEGVETLRLDFPMTRERAPLEEAWKKNADLVARILYSGKNAAFLTLGDPLVYSTFGYLMRSVLDLDPDLRIRAVPGITSFQEAAAKTLTVLCEGEENLVLISGINQNGRLSEALSVADSAVVLKAYKNAGQIFQAVDQSGRADNLVFASRLGLEGEIIGRGPLARPEKAHYLSLLLLPPKREAR